MTNRPLPVLEDFPARATDTIRYADTDRQGHVNNAVFSTFLETGRVMFLLGASDRPAPSRNITRPVSRKVENTALFTWPCRSVSA